MNFLSIIPIVTLVVKIIEDLTDKDPTNDYEHFSELLVELKGLVYVGDENEKEG